MGSRKLWLWPLYPLRSASGGNIQRDVDAEDGEVVSVEIEQEPIANIEGSDRFTADYYVSTAKNLAVIANAFPEMNPSNPDWAEVEAQLIRAGFSRFTNDNAWELVGGLAYSILDDRRVARSFIPELIRAIEEEVDLLTDFACKAVALRLLHVRGDGRKYDNDLLKRCPQYAEPFDGASIGASYGRVTTRLFCDALGTETTSKTMNRDDWSAISNRLESLDRVIRVIVKTSLVDDRTRDFCRDASGVEFWLRFLAGVSWQKPSPIEAAEIRWPVASDTTFPGSVTHVAWEQGALCSSLLRDGRPPEGLPPHHFMAVGFAKIYAPPPVEWIGNPPKDFFEVTLEKFLYRSVEVCKWLVERLKEWSEASQSLATSLPLVVSDSKALAEPALLTSKDAAAVSGSVLIDDASRWMKFVEAEELSGINRGNIQRAADRGEIIDNGERGRARRIGRESFTHWWQQERRRPERQESADTVNRKLNGGTKR